MLLTWIDLDRTETPELLAASWSLSHSSRRQARDIALVLIASWVTALIVGLVIGLSGVLHVGEVNPILFAGAVLALITVLVLAAVWSRRWN